MNMRIITFSLLLSVYFIAFISCEKQYSSEYNSDDISNEEGYEDESDYTWNDGESTDILLNGSAILENSENVASAGTVATITSAGTYNISGTLIDGQIVVRTGDEGIVRIILNGVTINSNNSAPVLIKNATKVMIVLAEGTVNNLTDRSSHEVDEDNEHNAVIFSKSYLSLYGSGILNITGNYEDGIVSKDGLVIKSGNINIKSVDDGIRGKDYLVMRDGNVTIESGGDAFKSDNETEADKGYIKIESGSMSIISSNDGITAHNIINILGGSFSITTGGGAGTAAANTGVFPGSSSTGTISKKGLKASKNITIENGTFVINSSDDAFNTEGAVLFNGGEFTISSGDDAIHADVSVTINCEIVNILKSYEGIESASITVNKGSISLVSTDDGFNATKGQATESNDGSLLTINGGNIVVNSSAGDAIDSNGNVNITAGTTIVHGPKSAPEVGFDINGTFNVSGGFLIGSGPNAGNMIEGPASSSGQYSIKAIVSSTIAATSLFHIQDANGNDLVTFRPVRTQYYFVFSSSEIKSGATYSIYTGGEHSGIERNGLYSNGTYTGGTMKKSFAVSAKVTNISL